MQPVSSYASQRNSVFSNTQGNLVPLVQRYQHTVAALPVQAQRNWHTRLNQALRVFRQNHPGIGSIQDPQFRLCRSESGRLSQIYIDTTMQRELNLSWLSTIISNFRAWQAQPIQVYESDLDYGAWDGQHTAVCLYLISQGVFGQDPSDVAVPINIYSIASRGEIRNTFITLNSFQGEGAGKRALDLYDIFTQMIHGVQADGVQEPAWQEAHKKWQLLAAAGMFVTDKKFNDHDQPGAVSRLDELHKASLEVVRQFAWYGQYVVALQNRAINAKEIPILIEFFRIAELEGIRYSQTEVESLAQHCVDLFGANFDADGAFWAQAHRANINAYMRTHANLPEELWPSQPKNSKNVPQGMAFFWHQLNRTWRPTLNNPAQFPKQPTIVYTPDPRDLF